MVLSCIKLRLVQFSSNFITTYQSSIVNNRNIHHNHLFSENNLVQFSNRLQLAFRSLPKRLSLLKTRFIADMNIEAVISHEPQGISKVLSSTHEKTLRVASIARKLGQGMHDTLGLKQEFSIEAYEPGNESNPVWTIGRQSGQALRRSSCDTWRRYSTKHLEGAEWKITVIDSPEYNACLYPGKHIFVLTQMIDSCSDEELASNIGHEMGHGIAQHTMNTFGVALFNKIMSCVCQHLLTSPTKIKLQKFVKDHSFRREELEADYIGMMLMASAGYHPRVAVTEVSKAEYADSDNNIPYSDDEHPSSRERIEYLKNPERMKKAMCLFRDYQLRSCLA